ncbi:MAG: sigma-70 family RNA polymerase sigma factor [Dinghuibacter sp.]|nr:sigma-70 family RNA polymerase sigma factor [Dinghuibacter sp.]
MTAPAGDMALPAQNIIKTIREYGKQLFGFIRSRVNTQEDAEDILQDVWVQLSRQPEIEAMESIRGWLYRVARNRITDNYRKKQTQPVMVSTQATSDDDGEWALPEIAASSDGNPETTYLREMFKETLFAALEELPENQRRVFELNEFDNLTLQQIADQEGENLKTIISRKGYAVKHLRKRLEIFYNELVNY